MALTALAGAASASASTFNATVPGTAITGVQAENNKHVITIQGQKFTCETAEFLGTMGEAETAEQMRLHPVYDGCTVFGFQQTVNTAGCIFNFNANITLGGSAPLSLEGCSGGRLTILLDIGIATCEVQVPNQSGINGQKYNNLPGGNLEVVTNSTNIVANVTKDEGLCPLRLETGATMTYTGHTVVTPAAGTISWVE